MRVSESSLSTSVLPSEVTPKPISSTSEAMKGRDAVGGPGVYDAVRRDAEMCGDAWLDASDCRAGFENTCGSRWLCGRASSQSGQHSRSTS